MKKFLIAALAAVSMAFAMSLTMLAAHAAGDMSGTHKFFNDDRNQFVDFWQNTNGRITIKVSNGRPWSPMWVVVHATFMSGSQVVGKKDYHVFCGSPKPGGKGGERWFVYNNPGFGGVTDIVISTSKEKPWGNPQGGWEVEISGSGTF
jgi:hypothetical protein